MMADFAIDTNIAIYALSEGPKADAALSLLQAGPNLSVQLLNEFVNVSLRKRQLPWPEVDEAVGIISSLATSVRSIDSDLHRLGRGVAKRHKLGIYDALIIAAALLDECETLFSEDMQHGLVIDGRLTITNPFLATGPQ